MPGRQPPASDPSRRGRPGAHRKSCSPRGRSRGSPTRRGTGYPGLLPQLCLRQCAQPRGAADSSSHTHAGPGPSRPGSSFLGRKPSSAWVVTTILPFHSWPHQGESSLSAPVSDPARAAAGTVHPSSWSCDQPLATQPRLPLPPQLEARCPQETGQFRECPVAFANLLETRGHLPGPQRSHVACPARVDLQPHPEWGAAHPAWGAALASSGQGCRWEKTGPRSPGHSQGLTSPVPLPHRGKPLGHCPQRPPRSPEATPALQLLGRLGKADRAEQTSES